MYLVLPLGGYPKIAHFWQPIFDKVQKKLDKWKWFNLSRRGLTLCSSRLSNLPTYFMSTFLVPKKVPNSIERTICNFFWKGNRGSKLSHLVKGDLFSKSQGDGSLGLDKLTFRNMILLAKWGWRFPVEHNSL